MQGANAFRDLMTAIDTSTLHSRAACAFVGFMLLAVFTCCYIILIGYNMDRDVSGESASNYPPKTPRTPKGSKMMSAEV
jgi:hypothetical protein